MSLSEVTMLDCCAFVVVSKSNPLPFDCHAYKPEGEKNYRIQFQIAGKTHVKSAKTGDKTSKPAEQPAPVIGDMRFTI